MSAIGQLVDARAPRNHCEIRRETALAAELPQGGVVILDDFEHDVGGDVFLVLGVHGEAAHVGGVLDDVIDQPQETIDEIVPRARFVIQTTFDQFAIPGYQSHGDPPFSEPASAPILAACESWFGPF